MTDQAPIRCMQLPLLGVEVLMPNSAVAEIISYSHPEPEYKGSEWLDGMIFWRGVLIPVVSLEKMCETEFVDPGPRSRIAIIYNFEKDSEMPYLGIILQDIPRAYLAEVERMQEAVSKPDCKFLQCKADLMNEQLMIPDLEVIMDQVKQKVQALQK